jgi:NitT/TauT family transport system permease protein
VGGDPDEAPAREVTDAFTRGRSGPLLCCHQFPSAVDGGGEPSSTARAVFLFDPRAARAEAAMTLRWLSGARHLLVTFVLLFVVWEVSVRVLGVPAYVLPPPSKIFADLATRWGRVAQNTWVTAREIVAGYLLAVVVSIPLALTIAYSRFLEKTVYPVIVFFQIVPKIAIAPLFIIWFGFGFIPKLLLVFLLSFFPIVVSSIAGFKSVDPEIMDLARSTGASSWLMFRKIRFPHALPSVFTGLKVAAALSATAAVVAEFVASDKGLGYLLLEFNGDLNTSMVFATIIVLSIVGLIVYYAVEVLERLVIPWHVSVQEQTQSVDYF